MTKINKVEKDFFNCFGIKPVQFDFPDNSEYYPEITDEIYLRLICALNEATCQIFTETLLNPLKTQILRSCIDEIENPPINEDGDEIPNERLKILVQKIFKQRKR